MIAGMIGGDDRPGRGGEGGPDRAEARAAEARAAEAPAAPADRRALLWLMGAMTAWAGWFIVRTSFVAGGRRVLCRFADAMISRTYARTLGHGYGLNRARHRAPGDGFRRPLWTTVVVRGSRLP